MTALSAERSPSLHAWRKSVTGALGERLETVIKSRGAFGILPCVGVEREG